MNTKHVTDDTRAAIRSIHYMASGDLAAGPAPRQAPNTTAMHRARLVAQTHPQSRSLRLEIP
jgi:hypothetical protein